VLARLASYEARFQSSNAASIAGAAERAAAGLPFSQLLEAFMLTAQAVGERPRLPPRAFLSSDEEDSGSDGESSSGSGSSSGYESAFARRGSDSHRGSRAWLRAHQRLAAAGVSNADDPFAASALRVDEGDDAGIDADLRPARWTDVGRGDGGSRRDRLFGGAAEAALWDAAEARAVRPHGPPYPTASAAAVASANADLFARHFHCCEFGELVDIAKALDDVPLPFRTRYVFCMAPVDVDSTLVMAALRRYARHMVRKKAVKVGLIVPDAPPLNPAELEELEAAHAVYDLYLWLARRFPMQFTDLERATEGAAKTQALIQEGLRAMGDAALQRHDASAARGQGLLRGEAADEGADEGLLARDAFPRFGSSPAAASLRELFSDSASARARAGRSADGRRRPRDASAPFGLDDPSLPDDAEIAEESTLPLRFERLLKRLETRVAACVRPVMAEIQQAAQLSGDGSGALHDCAGGRQQGRDGRAAKGKGKHGGRGRHGHGDDGSGGFGRDSLDPRRFAGFENTGRGGERYEDDIDALASGLHRVAMFAMVQAGALDAGGRSAKRGAQRGKGRDGRGLPFGGIPRGGEMSALLKELQRLKAKAVRGRQVEEARSSGLKRGRLVAASSGGGRGRGGGRGMGDSGDEAAYDGGSGGEYSSDVSDEEDRDGDGWEEGYASAGGFRSMAASRYDGGIPDGSRRSERLSPAELQRQYQAFLERRLRLNTRLVQRNSATAGSLAAEGRRGRSAVGASQPARGTADGDEYDEEEDDDGEEGEGHAGEGEDGEGEEGGDNDDYDAGRRRGGRVPPGVEPDDEAPLDGSWQSPRDRERRQRRQVAQMQLTPPVHVTHATTGQLHSRRPLA
jgi:hypothetical protein